MSKRIISLKSFISFMLAVIFTCAMNVTAFAHDVPDMNREGTIEITMHRGDTAVGGGTLTLYRVGAVREEDGNYSFQLTDDFAGSDESLEDLQSVALAKKLAQYAKDYTIQGVTKEIGQNGQIVFDNLKLGLYLLVQENAAEGYFAAEPFLVSVPMMEDGQYIYKVNASPKVELEKETETEKETESEEETETEKETENGTETVPSTETPDEPSEELEDTGQLNWPVPVLTMTGLVLFAAGWVLRFGQRKKTDEK